MLPLRFTSLVLLLFFFGGLAALPAMTPATAQTVSRNAPSAQLAPQLRPGDELWFVSSRRLGSRNCDVHSLQTQQYLGGQWLGSAPASLFANVHGDLSAFPHPSGAVETSTMMPSPKPMIVLVHGNSWSYDTALKRGIQTYQEVIVPWIDKPPLRFVIWTWPSDSIPGPIRDIRVKSELAEEHGFHLARFLQQLPASPQVALIGFSYGARVTIGAMNLLGGGSVNGGRIAMQSGPKTRVNLTLIAPAIRNDALVTSMPEAYGQINHLFVMYNSRDRFLSLFRLTNFSDKTPALGFTGLKCRGCLPNASMRIDQFDAAQIVGRDHDYLEYIRDQSVEQRLRRNLFFEPI